MAGQAGGGAALSNSAPASSLRPNLAKGPSWTARCSRALHRLNSRTLVYLSSSENTARLSDSWNIRRIFLRFTFILDGVEKFNTFNIYAYTENFGMAKKILKFYFLLDFA